MSDMGLIPEVQETKLIPEAGLTLPEQMLAVKERMDKHKRKQKIKKDLSAMQGSLDRLLNRASVINVKTAMESMQRVTNEDAQRLQHLLNTFRRGWNNRTDKERLESREGNTYKFHNANSLDADGMTQVNNNSPETT